MIQDLIKLPQPPQGSNRKRKTPFFRRWWVKWGLMLSFLAVLTGTIAFFSVKAYYEKKAAEYDLSTLAVLEKSSLIFDRNGEEIGSFFVMENRRPVAFNDVPTHFIHALVAEEDSRFWEHNGVDYMGIARAVVATAKVGRVHQGASTITQQLARQGFGMANQKTLSRKFTEIFLARRIESTFNKQQILELYLNRIYFGSGFYGVNAAALGYFGKPVNELTIDESATLAGLIKAPNRCSPLNSMDEAIAARNHVLNRMLAENYITAKEHADLKALPIKVSPGKMQGVTGYVQAEVRSQLIQLIGYEQTTGGGFRVFTTVDSDLQTAAEKALNDQLTKVEETTPGYKHETMAQYKARLDAYLGAGKNPDAKDAPRPAYLQGAVVALDNSTGAILSLVGGRDFYQSQYNRAVQGRRPAGTAFLPFVYGAAFENGAYPGTRVKDTPLDNTRVMIGAITGILGEWGTEDPNATYQGDINARRALVLSRNGSTVRLGSDVGLTKIQDFAKRAGIQSPLQKENKALLGSSPVTPTEMALAYSTFAGLGKRPQQPYLITKIEDHDGKVIYHSKTAEADFVQATDEFTAFQVHSCLEQALREGPGGAATREYGLGDLPAGGKTGTHSSFTDLWFAGYTSQITCAVWVGMDRPITIFENAFSHKVAEPVWVHVMKAASAIYPAEHIQPPPGGESIEVCSRSGLRATDNCYEPHHDPVTGRDRFVRTTYRELVRPGYKVTDSCHVHSKRPEGEIDFDNAPLAAEPAPIIDPRAAAAARSTEAVLVMTPTLLGDADPYQAVKSVVRVPKAQAVSSSEPSQSSHPGEEVLPQRSLDQEKGRLDLRPPEPVKFD